MSDEDFEFMDLDRMEQKLLALKVRHRELDEEVQVLEAEGAPALQVMALKREKLRVKDQISWLASRLTPDIIA